MNYIAYLRCSTKEQGQSGLGLEGQRTAINQFIAAHKAELTGAYMEINKGGNNQRPQLLAAIDECKRSGAVLVVSRLDRLSRSVAFIAKLIEDGIRFKCADCPNDDTTMLHFRAVIAEDERRKISERTKAAMEAARDRGVKLGGSAHHPSEVRAMRCAKMREAKAAKRAMSAGHDLSIG